MTNPTGIGGRSASSIRACLRRINSGICAGVLLPDASHALEHIEEEEDAYDEDESTNDKIESSGLFLPHLDICSVRG